ncbi:MAG: hypothetical protein JST65_17140 [Acidobacteria bacterium]|nr:hypothetical protein [Acidobacteriota bacterium]
MKPEYDFSKGERGKFFHKDVVFKIPVYLESDVQDYLTARAEDEGVPLEDVVNRMLKHEIELMEAAK